MRASTAHRRATIAPSIEATGLGEKGWNALAARGDTKTIFQTHQWMRSWWTAFGDRYEPLVVMVSNGSEVVGVAPLVVEQRSSRERVVRFLSDGRADYCDVLTGGDPGTVSAILDALHAYGRWDALELNNLPSESRTIDSVVADCNRRGCRALVTEQFICPTLLIREHQQEARAILEKPSLRRRTRRFDRAGQLTYRTLRRSSEVEPYLDRFFAQHIARWRKQGNPSLFLEPRNQTFYRELTRNLDGHGLLFSVVDFEGEPIAFHFGFDYDDSIIWYKPSFDIAHAQWSPGLVLVQHLLSYAIASNRRELDFTIGDEAFKRRFTNFTRKTVQIRVFKETGRYALARSRRSLAAVIKKASMLGNGDVR